MTPKWKVALGHLYEYTVLVVAMAMIFVLMPLGCGQNSRLANLNGQTVQIPEMPFYRIPTVLAPNNCVGTDSYGILVAAGTPCVTTTPGFSFTALGDSITCGWIATQGSSAGSSPPYSIHDPGCNTANGWPYLYANASGVSVANYAIPADQACDIWVRQLGPQSVSPSLAYPSSYGMLIGTNDANAKGTGAYEAVFNACQRAAIAWLAVPAEYKSLPGTSSVTGGFQIFTTGGSVPTIGPYAVTTSAGTNAYALTSYGGPIYLWHTVNGSLAGVATVSVDGVSVGTFNTQTSVPISTQNGTNNSVGIERYAGIPAGNHTVTVSWVSGAVAVVGVATPSPNLYGSHPVVSVGSVPLPQSATSYGPGSAYYAAMTQYSADIAANAAGSAADGLDVRFSQNHSYLLGTTAEYTDNFHVSPLGAQHLSQAFIASLQPNYVPIRPVSFSSTANGYSVSGGTTSGTNANHSSDIGTICNGACSPGSSNFAINALSSGSLAALTVSIGSLSNGGSFDVLLMSCSGCSGVSTGGTMTIVNRFTVTPTATGLQTFYAGRDFTAVSITSGQYLGVYQNGAYVQYAAATGGYLYVNGTNPSSGTAWSGQTGYTADFSANIGGTVSGGGQTTDSVPVPGMIPSGHCSLTPTNASAAANVAASYVSAKAQNSITVSHPGVVGMTFDAACTPY